MNYTKILKRAWDILWSYKTLWVFGILLALTTNSGFNGGSNSSYRARNGQENYNFTLPSDIRAEIGRLFQYFNQVFSPENRNTVIGIGIAIFIVILLLAIISRVVYYVSQTALIKMVDNFETSGEKVSWRQGFRLGWSRHAWQLFLINLVIFLPLTLMAIVFLGCASLPVVMSLISNNKPTVPGIIASVGLFFLIIFILAIVGFILSLFIEIIYRECVLKGNGVIASIRNGWKKVIQNVKDVFLMWLILIGIRLGYFIVTIPIVLLLLGIALLTGGGVGVAIYFIINTMNTTASWIMAAIVGGFLFLVIFSTPKLFLDGLFETYNSSVWTLTYRELNGMALNQVVLPPSDEGEQNIKDEELPSPI